jgi:NAD(P)-dependent dehydrogenase (short-subunit alcohol dehydrogenase family)
MGRLDGKVAIVTGGGHGIGKAIATRFAEESARVVVDDVNEEWAQATAKEIGGIAVAADVSNAAEVDRLFAVCVEQFGPPDVLVNNAGLIDVERHVLEADEAWWDQVIDVNLKGEFLCALAAAKLMAPLGRGSIINLSSGGGQRAHRGMVSYDAAKGGVDGMTRALALDLAPYGIRVNALAPGAINVMGLSEEEASRRGETIPLGYVGAAEDMAGPAVFLASDESAYVTGVVLSVDGGLLAQQRSPQVDIFPLDHFPRFDS